MVLSQEICTEVGLPQPYKQFQIVLPFLAAQLCLLLSTPFPLWQPHYAFSCFWNMLMLSLPKGFANIAFSIWLTLAPTPLAPYYKCQIECYHLINTLLTTQFR